MNELAQTPNALQIPILFEDNTVVVINKPPGVIANRAESVKETTLQDWMEMQAWYGKWPTDAYSAEDLELYKSRSGLVHRLDKDTSGVMVFAKNPASLIELMRQFRDRETKKTYLALVHGKFTTQAGTVKLPLSRGTGDRERFVVDPEGRESETEYTVLEFYPHGPTYLGQKKIKSYQGFSLVELQPKTGRTHQIRVHMSYIKHPLVGDLKYVGRKRSRVDGEWCPRQFLHAKQLCFAHPISKETTCYQAELPQDLQKVLKILEESL